MESHPFSEEEVINFVRNLSVDPLLTGKVGSSNLVNREREEPDHSKSAPKRQRHYGSLLDVPSRLRCRELQGPHHSTRLGPGSPSNGESS
jgi:hypothetical protein